MGTSRCPTISERRVGEDSDQRRRDEAEAGADLWYNANLARSRRASKDPCSSFPGQYRWSSRSWFRRHQPALDEKLTLNRSDRTSTPRYGFFVLNRQGLEYVQEFLTPESDVKVEGEFILYEPHGDAGESQ